MKLYYLSAKVFLLTIFLSACGELFSESKEASSTNDTTTLSDVSYTHPIKENNSCYINFPDEQAHLAAAECLSLPLSSEKWFQSYPKLSNGYLDLDKLKAPEDYKELLYTVPSSVPEYARILGIIPYDDKLAWILVASNRESEESEDYSITEQVYELFLIDRKNFFIKNKSFDTIGIGAMDSIYESFYNNPKLLKPPFNFKKNQDEIISYRIKDTLELKALRQCNKSFTIDSTFTVTTHRVCYIFNKNNKSLESDDKNIWKLNKKTMEFEEQEI